MLVHTGGSAAEALRHQGSLPEYLGYLGWPLLVVLAATAIVCGRPAGRPCSARCGCPPRPACCRFMGPAWNGRACIDGDGTPSAGVYLTAP